MSEQNRSAEEARREPPPVLDYARPMPARASRSLSFLQWFAITIVGLSILLEILIGSYGNVISPLGAWLGGMLYAIARTTEDKSIGPLAKTVAIFAVISSTFGLVILFDIIVETEGSIGEWIQHYIVYRRLFDLGPWLPPFFVGVSMVAGGILTFAAVRLLARYSTKKL